MFDGLKQLLDSNELFVSLNKLSGETRIFLRKVWERLRGLSCPPSHRINMSINHLGIHLKSFFLYQTDASILREMQVVAGPTGRPAYKIWSKIIISRISLVSSLYFWGVLLYFYDTYIWANEHKSNKRRRQTYVRSLCEFKLVLIFLWGVGGHGLVGSGPDWSRLLSA